MSLITNLSEKMKHLAETLGKSKIAKSSLAFALGLTIAVGATACRPTNNPNTDDNDHTITDPSGSDNNPGGNYPGGNSGTTDTDPYSKYSKVLQNVLKSDYYNNLIDEYLKTSIRSGAISATPFKLLADLGIDIDVIKTSQVEHTSTAYIKGKDTSKLYVTTKVENKSSTPYYHCITACYELNKEEYNDLEMLHRNQCIQAPLFIQELSYQKKPIDYTYSKIATNTLSTLQKYFIDTVSVTDIFNSSNLVVDFDFFSLEDQQFGVTIRSNKRKTGFIGSGKIAHLTMKPIENVHIVTLNYDSSVFLGPSTNWVGELQDIQDSCEEITYFYYGYDNVLYTDKIQ